MRKPYLITLFLTIALLFSLALGVLYLKHIQNKFISPTVVLVEKREQLIREVNTGKIQLTKENLNMVISSIQKSDISLIEASKTLNKVYSSLAFLLLSIALFQFIFIFVVKHPSK